MVCDFLSAVSAGPESFLCQLNLLFINFAENEPKMILEICASNAGSAINAQKGGADRIELCAELAVGGITPSYGMTAEVLKQIEIPVFALVRPRSGDFCYSDAEFSAMKRDIEIFCELGCAGIVSGILRPDLSVDEERTSELIGLVRPLEFTFHRGFDRVTDPMAELEKLIGLGADRILTSGQSPSAEEGLDLLKRLNETAAGRLKIMPGGGIGPANAALFDAAGFEEIHASATIGVRMTAEPGLPMNSLKFFDENLIWESDPERIAEIKRILND